MSKTAVASDNEPRPFFSYFNLGAAEQEAADEQGTDEPYLDYRRRMGIQDAEGDMFGASYEDDASGMPSWTRPFHHAPEATVMDGYAAERTAAGIPETTVLHGFTPANPRSHSSPYSL